MRESSPMNAGDGTFSYTKNSTVQRDAASSVKDTIKEAIMENFDIEKVLGDSTTLTIADLGCSVGPNTVSAMESLLETVEHKCRRQGLDGLEFQVLFNDQIGNDFNTLFAALPQPRSYFASAVPGSFYGRLFPCSSVHVAYSSYAINWLSRVPEELQRKDSRAWNAGRIHYSDDSSEAVLEAYADQFQRDMEAFVGARAREIAPGGVMVIVVPGVPDGAVTYSGGVAFRFIESILSDMVKEGVIEQEQVDSFNVPNVYPCVKDLSRVVERNGCFEIVKMEFGEVAVGKVELENSIMVIRAIFEGCMANHFGAVVVNQLFVRAMQHKLQFAAILNSAGIHGTISQIMAVLKRI
ncbi:loganic acid O-methyltransferase-like [Salvia splendens]|uniref:loganic acid O-methyltransferase-like n=1 Tax=Salvia splendens TaxID=180675 RepID=UPI001C253818|nr:loganic acid O-methyltransferase-like [Salvia splendens]